MTRDQIEEELGSIHAELVPMLVLPRDKFLTAVQSELDEVQLYVKPDDLLWFEQRAKEITELAEQLADNPETAMDPA